jgi:hypothetical protein
MYQYARCLEEAWGVEQDFILANHYYRLAADLGHAHAMYEYGRNLDCGQGIERDRVSAASYYRMAAESDDPILVWKCGERLMARDWHRNNAAEVERYQARAELSTDAEALARLGVMIRHGWELGMRISTSFRLYQRSSELGSLLGLEQLALCYEMGIAVGTDLAQAARLYQRASERGSRASLLSLGVFHWRGVGGFAQDREEAVRLWRLGGFEIADPAMIGADSVSIPPVDSGARSFRFFDTAAAGNDRPTESDTRRDAETCPALVRRHPSQEPAVAARDPSDADAVPDDTSESPVGPTAESFTVHSNDFKIDDLRMPDGRYIPAFLEEDHSPEEIARLTAEGISREGSRCLEARSDLEAGKVLSDELTQCDTIESLLLTCAAFYTRETFLYRRVNTLLRFGIESDPETTRNLTLYITLLRECFCVYEGLSPLPWEQPEVVYRGASLSIDLVVDHARHPGEFVHWQGFTSASRDAAVALGFPGNVLFDIRLTHAVPYLDDVSAFKHEHEVILSPFQWFSIDGVRWHAGCRRWIVRLGEVQDRPDVHTFFLNLDPREIEEYSE